MRKHKYAVVNDENAIVNITASEYKDSFEVKYRPEEEFILFDKENKKRKKRQKKKVREEDLDTLYIVPAALDILYDTNEPSDEQVTEFIRKEYPELDINSIDFIHDGVSIQLCDWNVGKPEESPGPFRYKTVFFK